MRLRVAIAAVAGLVFFAGWIAAATLLGDALRNQHPAVVFVYYAVAGFIWVFQIRWLMLWGAGMR